MTELPGGHDAAVLTSLVAHAVRAPSGHNSQPWYFELDGDRLLLRPDRRRALPVVDPDDRELTISCGAALGHLRVAIRHAGHAGDVRLVAEESLFAAVRLGEPAAPGDEELYDAIADRVTDRGPYDARPVRPQALARLAQDAAGEGVALHVLGAEQRGELADLVAEGDRRQFADPAFRRELAAWLRSNHTRRGDGMPGWAHGMGSPQALLAPLVMRAVDLGRTQARKDRALTTAAPALLVLSSQQDTVVDWLATGQALSTIVLRAAARGLAVSYLNQPVEVAALRPRLAALAGPGTPQLVLRLGYGAGRRPTPRRSAPVLARK